MKIPKKVTPDLAYISGVLAGDGSISVREEKYDYCLKCVGNPKNEKKFYSLILKKLFKKVFDIDIKPKLYDSKTTYGFCIWSKSLINFLNQKLDIPIGSKYDKLKIHSTFKKSNNLVKNYIQGLADTDFCLSLKRRYRKAQYYPVIEGVSKSKKFMKEISNELKKMELNVSESEISTYDERVKKKIKVSRIDIYGHNELVKWMKLIGFRNPKHLKKFDLWKMRNAENKRAFSALQMVAGDGFEPSTSPE